MYSVVPFFLSLYLLILALFLRLLPLFHTEEKAFMLLKLDIKHVLALKIMQVNIRSKLVHCKMVTDVPNQRLREAILL
jgi:hypothetical protein